MSAIEMRQVRKSFGAVDVIKGVDLDIKPAEFIVFVGPSGCGKSTLLRLVAGLEDVSDGEIRFDGSVVNDLAPAERGIAMVFQSYALYPHMSVKENMAFGLKLAKQDGSTVESKVAQAAKILQIEHLLERKPKQLSGGQRQRVAIGRAIVRDPRVFLFDEPLSNLDAALRVQMRIEIAKLHHGMDATMIYVTHDQVEAMTLADRIVVLDSGRVRQFGSPIELYQHPTDTFVAGFIGSPKMNMMSIKVSADDGGLRAALPGGGTLRLPPVAASSASGSTWQLGVRPEHLVLGSDGDIRINAPVLTVERLGAESWVYLDTGGVEPLVVKAPGSVSVKVGETASATAPVAAAYLFDPDGRCLPRDAYGG